MIKTGIGYDAHKLALKSKLILGGIEIPSEFGSVGHSDGDVLIPVSYTHLTLPTILRE